jgi:glycosyltransferase involved in cell wall biosynthesis
LDYTKHCFGTLLENAGCDFDWWVTDNGSSDGTVDWLLENTDATVTAYSENAGISPALNAMLDDICETADYDVIVKVDNDCELLTPNTLRDICERVVENNAILSPHIRGLRSTPQPVGRIDDVSVTPVVGGIFAAVPAWVFKEGYRHPIIPTLDGEDAILCQWFRQQGGNCGYVDWYEANHYETTDGQHARFPEYFARREAEREAANRVLTW